MIELSLSYWTVGWLVLTFLLLQTAVAIHFYSRGEWAALTQALTEEEFRDLEVHRLLYRDWRNYLSSRRSRSLAREKEVQDLRNQIAKLQVEIEAFNDLAISRIA
jgi:hypothetical protein